MYVMAEEEKKVYTEEAKTVEQLQEEIAALKEELADLQAKTQADGTDADRVEKAMEESMEEKDVKVEMLCRWAAARAGAIVIAPLVGTVALMANEVYLISRIAKVYDVKLTERALIAFLGAMGSRVAGSLLTTIIPFSAIQVPVAVGITYSLGRVTQRWLKDGMPTDMGPYVEMMGEWKNKAREQVDKLKENPLKNVPLGDETIDFMKKWGGVAKERIQDFKEKGEEIYQSVRHHDDLVDEIVDEKKTETTENADGTETVAESEQAEVVTTPAAETTKDTEAAEAAPEDASADEESETGTEIITPAAKAAKAPSVEDAAKAALEDAKTPLEDKE